jgi:aspartate/methionine/tyrosine aminotransferase
LGDSGDGRAGLFSLEEIVSSIYMPWAKLRSHAKYNLATSGVMHWKLRDLPVRVEDLEVSGASFYGYEPLQKALAAHCGVAPDRVVAASGTSMANYLALATLLKPGDEVLIERPTYELILAVARQVGATITRFERRHEYGFAIDPDAVRRAVTPRTKLIVVANLHNPTSALSSESTIAELGEIGPRVLVDEVYLDAAFESAPRSAALMGDQFVVTSSLTKVYGLSGLRCGWILAEPRLAEEMWRLNDLFGVIPAHLAERVSVIALGELPRIRENVRARLDRNRAALNRLLDSREDLECARMPFGTVVFPKLRMGSVERLCSILRERYEASVVPGEYFEMPDHFRVGIGGDAEMTDEGLRRLALALDDMMRDS